MILHGIIGPPWKQPSNGGPPVTVHTMSDQDGLVLRSTLDVTTYQRLVLSSVSLDKVSQNPILLCTPWAFDPLDLVGSPYREGRL
ncbi:hypothetical protein V6N13_039886 [Hibiscus sabdariffa]|uniref:Uncharacterized protein n=1 Tax=Hibiscus sabdariffa TaxID=183260 RepID=A0ABR2SUS3_9ROSI